MDNLSGAICSMPASGTTSLNQTMDYQMGTASSERNVRTTSPDQIMDHLSGATCSMQASGTTSLD